MNTERDLLPALKTWLHEDAHEYGDHVLDLVLDQLDSNPQSSASWLVRRFQMNNNVVRYGLVAAAVVIIAVVVINLLPGSPGPGDEPSATPEPSVAESAAPEPSSSEAAGLPVGSSHVLWDTSGDIGISVTIPAPGWSGDVGGGILVKNGNVEPPDGASMIVFQGDLYVYGDACHWSTTQADAPATTVDELVEALAAQTPRDAEEPFDITVDGYAGKGITLHVPEDAVYADGEFTDCDEGTFGSWTIGPGLEPHRYHQGPGQIDEVYILNVDGALVVIDVGYYAGTADAAVDELRGLVESASFEAP